MDKLEELEKRVSAIEARNAKVGGDKAWETSLARRALIAIFTYAAIGAYLAAIRIPDPWLNAVVPTVAFLLSTLVLPFAKDYWLAGKK